MKKVPIILFALSILFFGFAMLERNSNSLLPSTQMVQVGIIVEDIEKSSKEWASFLGLDEVPRISVAAHSKVNPTKYRGQASDASAKLAFLRLENITIELIQPLGGSSTWQEFLDTKGEGIHHIAFDVEDMDVAIDNFESKGISLIQHGGWDTGEYSYMDGSGKLGLIIELLEHYKK